MTVTTLIDNDIVIKLAQMDVYVDALAAIGVQPGHVASLRAMLRYMGIADAGKRERLTKTQAEAERLNVVLHSITELEMTEGEALAAAALMKRVLTEGLDLQEGELALLVVAVTRGALDVCTGDKRALSELPALEVLWVSLSALRGRLVCLEQLFAQLFKTSGFARIRTAVTTSPRADNALAFVYDKTAANGGNAFGQGLRLVIDGQIQQSAPGWLKAF